MVEFCGRHWILGTPEIIKTTDRRQMTYQKNNDTWRLPYSGMLRRVAHVRTEVPEEGIASIIRATRFGGLETTLGVDGNRRTLTNQLTN
jgi:hypothetical protein